MIVSLRAVEAFMFHVVTASAVVSLIECFKCFRAGASLGFPVPTAALKAFSQSQPGYYGRLAGESGPQGEPPPIV